MLRMEDVQRDCVARSLPCREQVKRIGSRFEDSLPELVVDGGNDWVTSRDSEAAFRLRDGEVKLVFTIDIEDCSPVLLLAALCEYDLSKSYNPDILEAEAVQHDGADSIWRVVKKSKWSGMLEDNIRYLSAIDALDESEPSLWVSLYAHCGMSDLDAADQETHGFRLPPPKPTAAGAGLLAAPLAFGQCPPKVATVDGHPLAAGSRRPSSLGLPRARAPQFSFPPHGPSGDCCAERLMASPHFSENTSQNVQN
eukprot:CAMPEP_0115161080 /NCGR_PEP_ID=MMETSP0227-20121206/71153_1 /TAXON_ID=89957 /ORGANISM="Polarella glacialis, Strain CCMP 1383" /LENGTH=252 /DNA_ID=CAMNT_0002573031 /DNA_START=461 /DNA_END=1220 /DNA_ORIENTATION=-